MWTDRHTRLGPGRKPARPERKPGPGLGGPEPALYGGAGWPPLLSPALIRPASLDSDAPPAAVLSLWQVFPHIPLASWFYRHFDVTLIVPQQSHRTGTSFPFHSCSSLFPLTQAPRFLMLLAHLTKVLTRSTGTSFPTHSCSSLLPGLPMLLGT